MSFSIKTLFKRKAKEGTVRRRILVPLTLTFFVLISTFIYGGYTIRSRQVLSELHHKYSGVQSLFDELLDNQAELMRAAAISISQEETLQQLFQAGDREQLQQLSVPYLVQITRRFGITHLYFHNPQGINFLRVHMPENYGDAIDRHVLRRAMKTKNVAYGLELGPLGTFTYRTVLPWIVDGQLVGYIELGQEIDHILKKLNAITNVDYLLTIDKRLLDRSPWEAGMLMLGRHADWNLLPKRVVIDQSLPGIQHYEDVARFFYTPESAEGFTEARVDDRIFRVKGFPLLDASTTKVGDFVVMHDATREARGFRGFLLHITLISAVLCSALFAFAYGLLGRMDKRLEVTRGQLYDQILKATSANKLLESEVVDRKRAELKLQKLNDNLEERVATRTAEQQRLNCELESAYSDLKAKHSTILHQDKMACIGQLAAGVAHDINNPIGFVANNLSELETYVGDLCQFVSYQDQELQQQPLSDAVKFRLKATRDNLHIDDLVRDIDEIINESLEGTERVSKIVQNLRTFSRIDDNDYEDANLVDCLESTINITWNELRYKADIIRDYGKIPVIRCYPGQLNQVFMNLLINAAQAISGYGTITVKTWADKDEVFVSIADTGNGIPVKDLQQIFEPFFTTKEVGRGTGLGLSITYDIIKRHQGEITVDSEIDKGTTFLIRLPVEVRDGQV